MQLEWKDLRCCCSCFGSRCSCNLEYKSFQLHSGAALAVEFQLGDINLSPCIPAAIIDTLRGRRRGYLGVKQGICERFFPYLPDSSGHSSCGRSSSRTSTSATTLQEQRGAGLQQYKCRHHCANYPDRLRGLAKVTGPTGQGNGGRCRVRLHRLGSLACAGNGKWGMENGKCLVEQNGQIRGERERHKTCAEWATICSLSALQRGQHLALNLHETGAILNSLSFHCIMKKIYSETILF